jgi:hypothetical protein
LDGFVLGEPNLSHKSKKGSQSRLFRMMLDQGASVADVMRSIGHNSISATVDVYGHHISDRGQ